MAIAAGASAIGLVSAMPSGPGVIRDETIRTIAAATPPGIATFLLTCRQEAASIVEQVRAAGVNVVQICDRLTGGSYQQLRDELPNVKIVQVIHVSGEESLTEAIEIGPHVDALLLDSGDQKLAVKQLGGTGRRHDWRMSRQIREAVDVPVWLAGGLRVENDAEAIATVGPFGLDVCSGVRTDHQLDAEKVTQMLKVIRDLKL